MVTHATSLASQIRCFIYHPMGLIYDRHGLKHNTITLQSSRLVIVMRNVVKLFVVPFSGSRKDAMHPRDIEMTPRGRQRQVKTHIFIIVLYIGVPSPQETFAT